MDPSVLEIFILSLLDRGFKTSYDLQRQAGLSLGSTLPALRRLELKGLIKRQDAVLDGARPKHSLALTPLGKKLARSGWEPFLEPGRTDDLDAILRIVEMARANDKGAPEIRKFLQLAGRMRLESARSQGRTEATKKTQDYMPLRSRWNRKRLEAEANFLVELAEEYRKHSKRP